MKPEIVFGLEAAAWPALLVSASGAILRANATAISIFGGVMKQETPQLSAIWSPENGGTEGQFLLLWEQAPTATADLKFKVANGSVVKFTVAVCTFSKDNTKWYVLQLLPVIEANVAPATAPPAPIPTPAPTPVTPPSRITPVAEAKVSTDAGGVLLKQKLDCALQLARTVSLDFNNALTTVLGHTSLLLSKAEPGHPWRHSLIEVEKSAARAAEIANELQTFSRQEKETHQLPAGNLNAVATRCIDFFRNANGDKIKWVAQLERDSFAARFDEAKVQQALTKVLENAAEAVPPGNGQISVLTHNVELSEPTQDRNVRLAAGTYVCVEVTDNGVGIDPEVLPRIFEPFFTTKGKSHRGLGLALVYGIVSNHGGGVAVSSQPGSGTSARIYLPAEKHLARANSNGNLDLHGTETILAVDDENMVLTMTEAILTEFGYHVLTASSGQKALTIVSRGDTKIDLVVTDMVMPGMNGRELAERLRQLNPQMKILCASGYTMPTDRRTDIMYLQKPFTSTDLLTKVKETLLSVPSVD